MAGDGSQGELSIYLEHLAQALQANMPPPPIPPDMPAAEVSEIDMLLASLHLAANSGDPKDMADGQAGFAQRGEKTGEAMAKFPASQQDSSKFMEQLLGSATQMPQQAVQAFSGLTSPFNQILQQVSQLGSQLASSAGKAGQGAGLGASLPASAFEDALGAGGSALGAGGAGAGLAGATTPAGNLGPPPTPSAGTYPASSPLPQAPVPPQAEAAGARGGQMGGMPMMPPGAAGAAGGSDSKAETKRVVPPSVKNGAPVQGRITTPQAAPEVVKRIAGKPIASRRILAPDDKPHDGEDQSGRNR